MLLKVKKRQLMTLPLLAGEELETAGNLAVSTDLNSGRPCSAYITAL